MAFQNLESSSWLGRGTSLLSLVSPHAWFRAAARGAPTWAPAGREEALSMQGAPAALRAPCRAGASVVAPARPTASTARPPTSCALRRRRAEPIPTAPPEWRAPAATSRPRFRGISTLPIVSAVGVLIPLRGAGASTAPRATSAILPRSPLYRPPVSSLHPPRRVALAVSNGCGRTSCPTSKRARAAATDPVRPRAARPVCAVGRASRLRSARGVFRKCC